MTHCPGNTQPSRGLKSGIRRREFMTSLAAGTAASGLASASSASATKPANLRVGEGIADITPPVGIELGGFHRSPGNERRARGIRQKSFVRVLFVEHHGTRVILISLDVLGIGHVMAARMRQSVAKQTNVPADNVRLCATHTHSTPGFIFLRQWGTITPEYVTNVEKQITRAVALAVEDLAPAQISMGKSRVVEGNFNRTTRTWKNDDVFSTESTHDDRWLDRMLHVLHFERGGSHRDLLWYHFSAHPVCFADELAGPDYPGIVAELVEKNHNLSPGFLQGHAGDVNPGPGPSRGPGDETAAAVYKAITQALDNTQPLEIDALVSHRHVYGIRLDIPLFTEWLRQYSDDPAECVRGHWVDARFAKAWYEDNADRDLTRTTLDRTISSIKLGPLAMVFHPTELYSYYGLSVRHRSPVADTLVVGYTDGMTGYLADPTAYATGDYGSFTVPKILDYPPFTPQSATLLADSMVSALREVCT
ncbi:MAG: neutral/alkaline non-lysosomal ceramidase N-terminal domain-containing protein [Fuerstiella sp.]|nr:neutral/alkaline non-lysosomal ceramidase N-terminal domain-containing protein [Fuerstiella sp.]